MKNKRFTVALAALLVGTMLCSCGGKTAEPENTTEESEEELGFVLEGHMAEMPNYALKAGATTDEIRAMAVKAMYDELSIEWYSKDGFEYSKTGVAEGRVFSYPALSAFAGVPYANGSSGLFHWLLFYDMRTGELKPFDTDLLVDTLGNTCYAGVTWGWAAVVGKSIGWGTTNQMTPQNGAILVGDYDIGAVGNTYKDHPTDVICRENGEQKMYAAYAQVKPADGLLYIPAGDGNHIRMAISDAVVVKNADGTINGVESYVLYQDQATGHLSADYIRDVEDRKRHFAGNTSEKFTFADMFNKGYIPITMKIFTGEEAYEEPKAEVKGLKDGMTFQEINKLSATDNFRMCYFRAKVTDGNGKVVGENLYILKRSELEQDKLCYAFPLRNCLQAKTLKGDLETGETYHMTVETQDATGTMYTLIDQDFVY